MLITKRNKYKFSLDSIKTNEINGCTIITLVCTSKVPNLDHHQTISHDLTTTATIILSCQN